MISHRVNCAVFTTQFRSRLAQSTDKRPDLRLGTDEDSLSVCCLHGSRWQSLVVTTLLPLAWLLAVSSLLSGKLQSFGYNPVWGTVNRTPWAPEGRRGARRSGTEGWSSSYLRRERERLGVGSFRPAGTFFFFFFLMFWTSLVTYRTG